MLIMLRKHKIESWKYAKNMLKTESDTENKPKINQMYTRFWARVREATASMWRGVASLTERCRGAASLQRGDAPTTGRRTFWVYLKYKKRANKATKWKVDANKHKSTSTTWYFTYLNHESSIKHANKHK